MKIKYSLIIPAYNAEKSIGKCLDSILDSKREDVEIIVIDDMSIDDTVDIVNEYLNTYSCIQFIHLDSNNGVSNARNIGILCAKGTFICFVDSDDYVSKRYFDYLDCMVNEKIDIAVFSNYIVKRNGEIIEQEQKYKTDINLRSDYIFQIAMLHCSEPPWNKVYRKDFIIENNIIFNKEMKMWEDLCFFITAVGKADLCKAFSSRLYYYTHVNDMSATSNLCDHVDDFLQMINCCWFYIAGNKLAEKNLSNFATNYLYNKVVKNKLAANKILKIREDNTVKKVLYLTNSNIKTVVKKIILKVKINASCTKCNCDSVN